MRMGPIFAPVILLSISAISWPQTQRDSAQLPGFMRRVIEDAHTGRYPSAEETAEAFDRIPSAAAATLVAANPEIQTALESHDPTLERIGIVAVYCIDQRSDSLELVRPLISSLLALLHDPDPQVAALAARSVFSVKPAAPHDVLDPMVDFLNGPSSQNAAGATIVFGLIRLEPDNESVQNAIVRFLRRPDLPVAVRIDCINALAVPGLAEQQIIDQIGSDSLNIRNSEVQLAAMRAIAVMGPLAAQSVRPILNTISKDGTQEPKVRETARRLASQSSK